MMVCTFNPTTSEVGRHADLKFSLVQIMLFTRASSGIARATEKLSLETQTKQNKV